MHCAQVIILRGEKKLFIGVFYFWGSLVIFLFSVFCVCFNMSFLSHEFSVIFSPNMLHCLVRKQHRPIFVIDLSESSIQQSNSNTEPNEALLNTFIALSCSEG